MNSGPNTTSVASAWGSPAQIGSRLIDSPNVRPAPPGGVAFDGRDNKCVANGDTCRAGRVGGELFCAGHLRALRKSQGAVSDE